MITNSHIFIQFQNSKGMKKSNCLLTSSDFPEAVLITYCSGDISLLTFSSKEDGLTLKFKF